MTQNSKRPSHLTETYIKKIKKPGVYSDGRDAYGLRLRVTEEKDGRLNKHFEQRMRMNGKEIKVPVGPHPLVSLAEARDKAFDNAKLAYDNIDPRTVSKLTVRTSSQFETTAEIMVKDWDKRNLQNEGTSLFSNLSERLIEDSLQSVRHILSKEGEKAKSVIIEGTHDRVVLLQIFDPDSVLMKMRKRINKADMTVFQFGAEWDQRVRTMKNREHGGNNSYKSCKMDFNENDPPHAVCTLYLSPLELVYYLENYTKHQALMQKGGDDGLLTVFTSARKGTIPIGSNLRFIFHRFSGGSLHVLGDNNVPDHIRPVRLYEESLLMLSNTRSNSLWTLEGDYGGVLLLKRNLSNLSTIH